MELTWNISIILKTKVEREAVANAAARLGLQRSDPSHLFRLGYFFLGELSKHFNSNWHHICRSVGFHLHLSASWATESMRMSTAELGRRVRFDSALRDARPAEGVAPCCHGLRRPASAASGLSKTCLTSAVYTSPHQFKETRAILFARKGLSDKDEQEVLKPTSRGLSVLGRVARTQPGRWSGPSLCPPADYSLSFLKFLQRRLRPLCGVGVLDGFRGQSGSPDLDSNLLQLQSCRYTWRKAPAGKLRHKRTHRPLKPTE